MKAAIVFKSIQCPNHEGKLVTLTKGPEGIERLYQIQTMDRVGKKPISYEMAKVLYWTEVLYYYMEHPELEYPYKNVDWVEFSTLQGYYIFLKPDDYEIIYSEFNS